MNIVSDSHPGWSLFRILAVIVFFGWIVIGQLAIGSLCGVLIYGDSFMIDLSDPQNHPEIKNAYLLTVGMSTLIGLIFLPWVYIKFYERKPVKLFFKNSKNWSILIVLIACASLGLAIAIAPVVEWNATTNFPVWMSGFANWAKQLEETATILIKMITSELTPISFAYIFFIVAIIPAIGEEIVFRGLIQTELQRWLKNPHIGIWLASALFSAIHFQFYGFVPRMIIGAFLGYIFYWSGNLWTSMLAHFFNNGFALIAEYLFQLKIITLDVNDPTVRIPLTLVATGIIITTISIVILKNKYLIAPNDNN